MLFNLVFSRRPTHVFVEILWFPRLWQWKACTISNLVYSRLYVGGGGFFLIVQCLHNNKNLIFHSISNTVLMPVFLWGCGYPFGPPVLWKMLTKLNFISREMAGSRGDNQALRTVAIIAITWTWKAASNRNISLFPLIGPALAAACDVCHPLLDPAVSFDIACRSTCVKSDFPTSGVKPPILQTQDGDG